MKQKPGETGETRSAVPEDRRQIKPVQSDMYYTIEDGHPVRHNPLSAIVTPRPIGWISTRASDGTDNLAPYSFFNLVAYQPPQVMSASTLTKEDQTRSKDTVANIEATGVFCVNVTEYSARDAVNASSMSLHCEVDEFSHANVEKAAYSTIPVSRAENAPASLECRLDRVIDLEGEDNHLVLGQVIAVHIREDCIVEDRFEVTQYQPLTRLGFQDYGVIDKTFRLLRPK